MMYTKKPHLVCLQETWLHNDSKKMKILGYNIIRKDRTERGGGGLLFAIREDLIYREIKLTEPQGNTIECQAIELSIAHDKIQILNLYNPTSTIEIEHLDQLINQMERKFIIMGDLNGHHPLWDPNVTVTNQCGRELSAYILDSQNLNLVTTPGLKTYTDARSGKTSTLDLALCTNNLIQVCSTTEMADAGSDHTPINVTLSLRPDTLKRKKRKKWKIDDKKLKSYAKNIPTTQVGEDSTEGAAKNFTRSLVSAAETTFGRTSGNQKTMYSKPWWTNECSKIIAKRRRAKKTMERNPTIANIIEYRRISAKAKQVVKRTKRELWRKFCNTLTVDTPPTKLWNMIRSMNGKTSNYDIPLHQNGLPLSDPTEKANLIAESLDNILGIEPNSIDEPSKEIINTAKNESRDLEYNKRFSMKELQNCIDSLPSDKTTGEDEIHNKFLKNLPTTKKQELLGIINRSWRRSEIPTNWTSSEIIPIGKPGKDLTNPDSYRPISLLSCTGKVMEKMINNRLIWILEKNKNLSPTQCGFRKKRSTEDLLVKLEHQVRTTLVNRKIMIAVFFDLQQAFDTISHDHLLLKLANNGIKGNMLAWTEKFIKERKYHVIIADKKSEQKEMKRGVPQGSCLSPTFFNVMVSDIPHFNSIISSEFADDLAISTTADNLPEAINNINQAITELERWATGWNLHFNPSKTKAMCFTKRRNLQLPTLKILNEEIQYVKTFKYLGMTLDAPTLTWKEHIDDIILQTNQRLNIMRAIAGTNWGAERELLLRLYTAYIRPKLLYGATALSSACETRLEKLETIQNTALRIALGARKTSPIASLQAEANIPPLKLHIKEICCKYFLKLRTLEDHPTTNYIIDDPEARNKVWTHGHFKKPLIKRVGETMYQWNIPMNIDVREKILPDQPPWDDIEMKLQTKLSEEITKEYSVEQRLAITNETIETKYKEHLKIYTDGSIAGNSTSAAIWIPSFDHSDNWKMDMGETRNIMGAELMAINKALTWLSIHSIMMENEKVVILTDSMSSIQAMMKYSPSSHTFTINALKTKYKDLTTEGLDITIQYVPSHVGVPGNEKVDELAKAGHIKDETQFPLDKSEIKVKIKEKMMNSWKQKYEIEKNNGLHLGKIKKDLKKWPWTRNKCRRTETALCRLRIGHVGLKGHLNRFQLTNSPLCERCNVEETTEHFLLHCQNYAEERRKMTRNLQLENIVNPDITDLLGGGSFNEDLQNKIRDIVGTFINETGRVHEL